MNSLVRHFDSTLVASLRVALEARQARIVQDAIAIQQIPSPTFQESARAAYLESRFRAIGCLDSIAQDDVYNVYSRLPGTDPTHPALLVCAHTDTVFDEKTALAVQQRDGTVYGPGIGDNSLGVAALVTAMELIADRKAPLGKEAAFPGDIWFVANTREEGMGDLGGIKAVYKRLAPRLGSALVIEGMALGRIYHSGIAVRRLRIRCLGPGGHSWLHFGRASAIHGLMRLGAQIAMLRPPESPRTTFNIGVIEGGSTVNSIAAEASLLLDMRSESPESLGALEKTVMNLVNQARVPDLTFEVEVVGDRPAGGIPRNHPLVQLGNAVLEQIGIHSAYETGSTDANVMLAAGLPAITIGITQGGNAHRLDEYIETGGIRDGLLQLMLLIYGVTAGA